MRVMELLNCFISKSSITSAKGNENEICVRVTYTLTRPCEQGNWDTWMVLDPWNQV